MTHINKETIAKLSELSRIDCTEAEKEAILKDLEGILTYFDQLEELDTSNVPCCNQVLAGMANVTREDKVGTPLSRELFLSNAPASKGGLIAVPPVINKNAKMEEV